MANLSIHRSNGDKPSAIQPRDWEPMRALRELFRWDPFAEMMPSWSADQASFVPAFEVRETKDNFLFKADVPGISEADLDIRLAQNRLTISGKRELEKSDKGETYYAYERAYGSFTRSFTLPDGTDPDRVKAELKNGVLTLEIPKRPELQPKKISVNNS